MMVDIEWFPMALLTEPSGTRLMLWFFEDPVDSVTRMFRATPVVGRSVFIGEHLRCETFKNGMLVTSEEGWVIEGVGKTGLTPSMWAHVPEPSAGMVEKFRDTHPSDVAGPKH